MTTQRNAIIRRLVPVLVVASLAAGAPSVWSEPTDTNTPAGQDDPAARQARMQQHLQERLNRMAERLQITPAQQDAWAAYAGTVQRLAGTKLARPAPQADAASVARLRAELAAERAQKLAQLADATAALQQSLDPEQQQALGKIVRHAGRRAHHRRGP